MQLRILVFLGICVGLFSSCAFAPIGPEPMDQGVRFSLHAPQAKSVSLVGTFNQWDPQKNPLTGPDRRGIWTTLLPLAVGRHEYLFVINGDTWLPDPGALPIEDGMGSLNSLVIVE